MSAPRVWLRVLSAPAAMASMRPFGLELVSPPPLIEFIHPVLSTPWKTIPSAVGAGNEFIHEPVATPNPPPAPSPDTPPIHEPAATPNPPPAPSPDTPPIHEPVPTPKPPPAPSPDTPPIHEPVPTPKPPPAPSPDTPPTPEPVPTAKPADTFALIGSIHAPASTDQPLALATAKVAGVPAAAAAATESLTAI